MPVDISIKQVGLTACDAGYLWLARETGTELVSLDAQLEKIWRKP